jgi:ABC-2 type transport system ATP-binding protein
LDEPTTGIDVASSIHIRNLIKKLNDDGMTVFLTTHYIEEAERLCDRIAFINKGHIIKMDTVENFIEDISQSNVIEVLFESTPIDKNVLIEKLDHTFSELECSFKNENTIKVISQDKIDVSPIVSFLSKSGIYILEAKIIRPTLEDAFIKLTGIEIDVLKKEKEKK